MRKNQLWVGTKVAARVPFGHTDPMSGSTGSRKITFHTEGVRRTPSVEPVSLARYVNGQRIPYHLIWEPRTGKWAQLIPFDRAARSMKSGGVDSRGLSANRSGQRNIQICVAGAADGAWARGPLKNAWVIAEIMRTHRIPKRARKDWTGRKRGKKPWNNPKIGVHGHCHGPFDNHIDPGPRISQADVQRVVKVAKKQNKKRRG